MYAIWSKFYEKSMWLWRTDKKYTLWSKKGGLSSLSQKIHQAHLRLYVPEMKEYCFLIYNWPCLNIQGVFEMIQSITKVFEKL